MKAFAELIVELRLSDTASKRIQAQIDSKTFSSILSLKARAAKLIFKLFVRFCFIMNKIKCFWTFKAFQWVKELS